MGRGERKRKAGKVVGRVRVKTLWCSFEVIGVQQILGSYILYWCWFIFTRAIAHGTNISTHPSWNTHTHTHTHLWASCICVTSTGSASGVDTIDYKLCGNVNTLKCTLIDDNIGLMHRLSYIYYGLNIFLMLLQLFNGIFYILQLSAVQYWIGDCSSSVSLAFGIVFTLWHNDTGHGGSTQANMATVIPLDADVEHYSSLYVMDDDVTQSYFLHTNIYSHNIERVSQSNLHSKPTKYPCLRVCLLPSADKYYCLIKMWLRPCL